MRRWLAAVILLLACSEGGSTKGPSEPAAGGAAGDSNGDDPSPGGAGGEGGEGGPAPLCNPTADGPFWLEEGERVAFDVRCATGASAIFTLTEMPAGASFDGRHFAWTPGLSQAAVYSLEFAAGGETGLVKVGVADAFDAEGNLPVVDPLKYGEELGLPVVFVSKRPDLQVDGKNDVPAEVTYGGHLYAAEVKLRGESSLEYPKKSYTLKFSKQDKLDDPERGFRNKREVVLTSTFDDSSYLRQRMVYDLWNGLSADNVDVQTLSAVVFVEGVYEGLYLLGDHVDGRLMEDFGLRQDGNLYKAVDHRANLRELDNDGAPKETLHDGYEKKEGLPADDFADLEQLISWLTSSSDAAFCAELDQRTVQREFEDWWMLVTFVLSDDSAGKNCYLYRDPLDPASRWRFVTWDHNASLGQDWLTGRQSAERVEDYSYANGLFARMLAQPSIAEPLRARYRARLAAEWSQASLDALISGYVREIAPSAKRDWRKWGDRHRSFSLWQSRQDINDFEGEVAYLREWLAQRRDFVAASY